MKICTPRKHILFRFGQIFFYWRVNSYVLSQEKPGQIWSKQKKIKLSRRRSLFICRIESNNQHLLEIPRNRFSISPVFIASNCHLDVDALIPLWFSIVELQQIWTIFFPFSIENIFVSIRVHFCLQWNRRQTPEASHKTNPNRRQDKTRRVLTLNEPRKLPFDFCIWI